MSFLARVFACLLACQCGTDSFTSPARREEDAARNCNHRCEENLGFGGEVRTDFGKSNRPRFVPIPYQIMGFHLRPCGAKCGRDDVGRAGKLKGAEHVFWQEKFEPEGQMGHELGCDSTIFHPC